MESTDECVKNNFIAITGGPGAGKSTLLDALADRNYKCVRETGRFIIKRRLDHNLPPRPAAKEFAIQMFELDHANYIENISVSEYLFFDRTFLDSAALLHQADKGHFDRIKSIVRNHRFYNRVFIAPPWKEIYRKDNERDQSFEESVATYEKLFTWYQVNGYQLLVIPKVSVTERVHFILDELGIQDKLRIYVRRA
jgi:predicted ATPase